MNPLPLAGQRKSMTLLIEQRAFRHGERPTRRSFRVAGARANRHHGPSHRLPAAQAHPPVSALR